MAADRHGSHGLGQGAGTSYLDDMINAGTSGPLPNPRTPIRMMTIVDGVIGAEAAGSLQFVVGGRRRYDGGSHGFGNLQCKDGNAAGAEDEHRVAGLQRTIDDEGPPSGHAGRGERGSFGERISFRRAGKRGGRRYDVFARISINPSPGTVEKSPTAGAPSVQLGKKHEAT